MLTFLSLHSRLLVAVGAVRPLGVNVRNGRHCDIVLFLVVDGTKLSAVGDQAKMEEMKG